MNEAPKIESDPFGKDEHAIEMLHFYHREVEILARIRPVLVAKQGAIWGSLLPMYHSLVETCMSIEILGSRCMMRDCYVLARTAFETAVNICFICAIGEEAANRAKRHAIQKSYRDLQRELDVNGIKLELSWSGANSVQRSPELQQALDEYTGRNGREITSWTPETVKQQLEVIERVFGDSVATHLVFGLLSIYRHASEIAHGTLFGALFALGLTRVDGGPKSERDMCLQRNAALIMVLMITGLCLHATIRVLSRDLDIDDVVIDSTACVNGLHTLSMFLKDDKTTQ